MKTRSLYGILSGGVGALFLISCASVPDVQQLPLDSENSNGTNNRGFSGPGGSNPDGTDENGRPIEQALQSIDVNVQGGKIDILFVIDNSGSMSNEISTVRTNFSNFLSTFVTRNLDYQVGVVTTDVDSPNDVRDNTQTSFPYSQTDGYDSLVEDGVGSLLSAGSSARILQRSMGSASVISQFSSILNGINTSGSGSEAGLASTAFALSPFRLNATTGYNRGLLRSDARLSVIMVSDENESFGYPTRMAGDPTEVELANAGYISSIPTYETTRVNAFVSHLRSLKDPQRADLLRLDAIVWPSTATTCAGAVAKGTTYERAVQSLGRGSVISLCNGAFGGALANLGNDISGTVERRFTLTYLPRDLSRMNVYLNDQAIGLVSASVTEGFRYLGEVNDQGLPTGEPGQIELVGLGLEYMQSFNLRIEYDYYAD